MAWKSSRLILFAVALMVSTGALTSARAEDDAKERAELAKAMGGAKATLQGGLTSAQANGTPISAKFEVEDGKLQLSVYTMKGAAFSEVVVNPATGKVDKSEAITDKDDLQAAAVQKAAMAKAKISLLAATTNALKTNGGYQAVSVYPAMKAGHPVAAVTLLRGTVYKDVAEKLD